MNLILPAILISTAFVYSCTPARRLAASAKKDVWGHAALQTAHVGISIFDTETNKYLYNYQSDKYFVPASNTKIPTCYAAMKYLGDSLAGLRYRYQQDLKTFYVLPTADPSFLHPDFSTHRVLDFYRQHTDKKFLFDTQLTWNEFAWGNGWSWNDYESDYMAERSPLPIYGNVVTFKRQGNVRTVRTDSGKFQLEGLDIYPEFFRKKIEVLVDPVKLSNQIKINRELNKNYFEISSSKDTFSTAAIPFVTEGVKTFLHLLSDTIGLHSVHTMGNNLLNEKVSSDNRKAAFDTPGKNLFLHRNDYVSIHSQPTDSLLKPMMHRSDNFFAEQSLLMVSNELLGVMNDAIIIDTLLKTDFKDLPQKPRWADGSGLSRYNLFTPQDFVVILNKMKKEFGMDRIKEIFPTGGEGTLSNYYKKDSTFIYAKTGTLSGVVALSGFLLTRKNKLLIFSVLVNNHQASATAVRKAVEEFLHRTRRVH